LLDVNDNTLHLVNYSEPFRGTISLDELNPHLHSLPDQPDAIPYLTSYYHRDWGFCLTDRQRHGLPAGEYEVVVDTALVDGSMTMSEAVLPGESRDEVLLSTYTCHPSMANNELSGPLVTSFLYRRLASWPRRRLTYRFLFIPETIGSITYLAQRGAELRERLLAGFVVTCVGDGVSLTLKRSRRGDTLADRAAWTVLSQLPGSRDMEFFPHNGSDERQYCSPGFNLPVASVMRSMYGSYPQYHTSLDDRSFIDFESMHETVTVYEEILAAIDSNGTFHNTLPLGEPQLGRRGLYPEVGGLRSALETDAIMWLLSFSDGEHDLLDIAHRSSIPVSVLSRAVDDLARAGLLTPSAAAVGTDWDSR
jgi:aminopeptidase-like protein